MKLAKTYRIRLENRTGGRRTIVVYAHDAQSARTMAITRGLVGQERIVNVTLQRS